MSHTDPPPGTNEGDDDQPDAAEALAHDDHLSVAEVRKRAVVGAAVDITRGGGIRVVGLVGTAVLARMLTPRDFGLIAVGATLTMFAGFVSDGGVGTALIRRPEPPVPADLKAFMAFQLTINSAVAALLALATLAFGEAGSVTAVMVLALPLIALRVPAYVLLERRLEYKTLALVEVIETIVYFTWSIAGVAVGWGVWALATGAVIRTLGGTIILLALVPSGRMLPSPSWRRVRSLLGFGFRVQAVGFLHLVRDQGLNLSVAAIGGVSVLGVWSVSYRIIQIPLLVFNSLWRVSFPSMSRLVAAHEDPSATMERLVGVVAVGSGLILAPLVASAPDLVPVLLGHRWSAAASPLAPALLGLLIGGPISVALVAYLWAVGDAAVPARAALITIPLMAVVAFPLLPVIGATAAGLALLISGVGEGIVVLIGARKHVEVSILRGLGPPVAAAIVAATAGWVVGRWIGPQLVGAVAAAAVAAIVYVLPLWVWSRSQLLDMLALGYRGMRGALGAAATG